ncbi:EamA family transporter [Sulfobacillus sp. hq2]|uniref:EamA domain-containing protein n=1 Tax=Sulfobacillus thermotolerans TaxID=338644 RepID=A0ABM6RPN2_9FIRM|nr:EamA family transporter [Sulfobacillus sp. hq2]AUW93297.1 hypothetical protein BXT84_04460 [Sulfobacillus thermotolerans]MCY0907364.1 EamA family transporter [Sulfobacillus thermotolerans]POB11623.1 hypothetical protein CO251_03345 [Sulfobacillus sp. hq2]
MDLWIVLRIVSLTGERLAYRVFGRDRASPWAVMGLSYVGAAVWLWAIAAWKGTSGFDWQALGPGTLYAGAFALSTMSLVIGEASQVSPWSNATTLLLFLIHPAHLPPTSWLLIGLFAVGAWWQVQGHLSKPVWMMLASDGLLAMGRLADVHVQSPDPWTYGASLMTCVASWMIAAVFWHQEGKAVFRVAKAMPVTTGIVGLLNAIAYVSVVILLKRWPASLVEASSAVAAFFAALIAVYLFREAANSRRIGGAAIMTVTAVLLILDYSRVAGHQGLGDPW